jgi:7,8-dihydropterin-6-yl-methyl-4-(beta-D-ribofuranosyl)aminobenzene 5'-phosphate synthase
MQRHNRICKNEPDTAGIPVVMDITLIAEGSSRWQRFIKYWGISFIVGDVLFDTFGRADIFRKNIKKHNIDLSKIKKAVISHDDWDHIAGLESFLVRKPDVPVYMCKNSAQSLKEIIKKNGNPLHEVSTFMEVSPNIFSLGQMRARTIHGLVYEQALAVKSDKGISVITGCAHPGIVNIVKLAISELKEAPYLICGGFHLKDDPQDGIIKTIGELNRLGVKKVIPLHCTGKNAHRSFRSIYADNCIELAEGDRLEI